MRTSTPPIVTAWFSEATDDGGLADRVVADVEDERDLLEHEREREGRHEHHRWRLRAQRPEDRALHRQRERDHDREAGEDARRDRPVGGERERVGAGHDQLAVGEVDEPEHPEDEPDPDRHQRVDGAEADGVDQGLGVDRGEEAHAR